MRKSVLMVPLLLMALAGCSSSGRVYQYRSLDGNSYEPVEDPVPIYKNKDAWFTRHGYRKIARIGVTQRYKECSSGCKYFKFDRTLLQLLSEKSAEKGGHAVQLIVVDEKSFSTKKQTMRCVRYHPQYEATYKVPIGRRHYVEKKYEPGCAEYETVHGREYYRYAVGYIWRKMR